MLVDGDAQWLAAPLGYFDRKYLCLEAAAFDRGAGALLTSQGELVLLLATNAPLLGHVLGRFAHAVGMVGLGQARIDEAPAKRAVVDGLVASRKRLAGLRHDERGAGHA